MAFKMNRPIIKGSALHKKRKVVSQARITPDAALVEASKKLGESMLGPKIDYSVDRKWKLSYDPIESRLKKIEKGVDDVEELIAEDDRKRSTLEERVDRAFLEGESSFLEKDRPLGAPYSRSVLEAGEKKLEKVYKSIYKNRVRGGAIDNMIFDKNFKTK